MAVCNATNNSALISRRAVCQHHSRAECRTEMGMFSCYTRTTAGAPLEFIMNGFGFQREKDRERETVSGCRMRTAGMPYYFNNGSLASLLEHSAHTRDEWWLKISRWTWKRAKRQQWIEMHYAFCYCSVCVCVMTRALSQNDWCRTQNTNFVAILLVEFPHQNPFQQLVEFSSSVDCLQFMQF